MKLNSIQIILMKKKDSNYKYCDKHIKIMPLNHEKAVGSYKIN